MQSTGRRAEASDNSAVSVTISAGSTSLQVRIERLARQAEFRLVGPDAKFQVLLVAIDSFAQFPILTEGRSVLIPSSAHVCVIWCGPAPTRTLLSQFLRAGVAGILSLKINASGLEAALNAIRSGLCVIDPGLLNEEARLHTRTTVEELTEREQEVLILMGEGLSNKEISSRLGISTHTVKFHISSVLGKLGAASRTEAVTIGVKIGKLMI